jgi:hypothetical protein
MTGMDELVRWLREQLDRDEGLAKTAFGDHNAAVARWNEPWSGTVEIGPDEDDLPCYDSGISRHIVNWDPARALAEVDAKRRILDLHAPSTDHKSRAVCQHCSELCHSRSGLGCDDPDAPYPCPTVQLVALPYTDRAGYREEWRP